MMLNRIGNKAAIAEKIIRHFPPHDLFIDLFWGAGGLFFKKPRAQYNICNDIDGEVINLYRVLKKQKTKLIEEFKKTPYTEELFYHWKKNKETTPLMRAVRFLFLSNTSLYGIPRTMRFGKNNSKAIALQKMEATASLLENVQFMNCDYKKVLKKIERTDYNSAFVYADPPYVGTDHNYKKGFKKKDFTQLLNLLKDSGLRFAVSEFYGDFVISEVKRLGLHYIVIGDRKAIKANKTEILITNYVTAKDLFSDFNN